jgi:cytochrome c oxidase assembly protein subunit 11
MSRRNGPSKRELSPTARRNRRIGLLAGFLGVAMVGAAFASVPLYRVFCETTGYDGAVPKAKAAPKRILDQKVTVTFDANVRGALPWDFAAEQRTQTLRLGETKVAFFKVTNHADHPIKARAVFNVTPEQAGAHFRKLQCFCFTDQTVGAGQTVELPVLYFIDPTFADDINTRNATDVTLSYTFFPAVASKATS